MSKRLELKGHHVHVGEPLWRFILWESPAGSCLARIPTSDKHHMYTVSAYLQEVILQQLSMPDTYTL